MLKAIFQYLQENDLQIRDYHVPGFWLNHSDNQTQVTGFNEFYLQKLGEILIHDQGSDYLCSISQINGEHHGIGGDWSYNSVVYNAFPRFTAAFDHNQSGDLNDYKSGDLSLKKTGTFLKMIAMLPYIKSLGVNVLHLMPVTVIGKDGRRGDLGSPYAIKNPYELDQNLAETAIPFSAEDQFKALTEACHMLGIRVVLEFVLRTASLDSEWAKEHPDWFYWIDESRKEDYQSPAFSQEELNQIKKIPSGHGEFISPDDDYQSLFKNPPSVKDITLKDHKWMSETEEGKLIIPGAFADWPPDDQQPPWDDVTYLRLYNDEHSEQNFNYIAYDTIRYYHPDLAQPENINSDVWNALIGIIPHYQEQFGIDGIMLDMGHALPSDLMEAVIEEARRIDSDFGFWEENFEIKHSSRWTGFNATLGFEWKFMDHETGMRNMLITSRSQLPLPFLGTPETHNTPRVKDLKIKKQYFVLNAFLPSCMPFIHSGYELNEQHPVNTGLNFNKEQLEFYKDYPLPLFHSSSLDWNAEDNLVEFIQKTTLLREKNKIWVATGDERTLTLHFPENSFGKVLAYERHDAYQPWKSILILLNMNHDGDEKFFLNLHGTYNNAYQEYLSGKLYTFEDHWLSSELEAGGIMIFELHKLL